MNTTGNQHSLNVGRVFFLCALAQKIVVGLEGMPPAFSDHS